MGQKLKYGLLAVHCWLGTQNVTSIRQWVSVQCGYTHFTLYIKKNKHDNEMCILHAHAEFRHTCSVVNVALDLGSNFRTTWHCESGSHINNKHKGGRLKWSDFSTITAIIWRWLFQTIRSLPPSLFCWMIDQLNSYTVSSLNSKKTVAKMCNI